jgi:hypothetical protein
VNNAVKASLKLGWSLRFFFLFLPILELINIRIQKTMQPFDLLIVLGSNNVSVIVNRIITLVMDIFFAIPVVHIFFPVKFGLLHKSLVNFIGIVV